MNFSPGLLLLILALPFIDLVLLIVSGRYLGALVTIVLVVFTSVLGFLLLQKAGTRGWGKIRQNMQQGEMVNDLMLHRFIFMICGILLLIPGFITDVLGLAGLLPWLRNALVARLTRSMFRPFPDTPDASGPDGPGAGAESTRTIEGEYKRDD